MKEKSKIGVYIIYKDNFFPFFQAHEYLYKNNIKNYEIFVDKKRINQYEKQKILGIKQLKQKVIRGNINTIIISGLSSNRINLYVMKELYNLINDYGCILLDECGKNLKPQMDLYFYFVHKNEERKKYGRKAAKLYRQFNDKNSLEVHKELER